MRMRFRDLCPRFLDGTPNPNSRQSIVSASTTDAVVIRVQSTPSQRFIATSNRRWGIGRTADGANNEERFERSLEDGEEELTPEQQFVIESNKRWGIGQSEEVEEELGADLTPEQKFKRASDRRWGIGRKAAA